MSQNLQNIQNMIDKVGKTCQPAVFRRSPGWADRYGKKMVLRVL